MAEYVAYTPKEGKWLFTRSITADEAVLKLCRAVNSGSAMSHPIDNPISAVRLTQDDMVQASRFTTHLIRG